MALRKGVHGPVLTASRPSASPDRPAGASSQGQAAAAAAAGSPSKRRISSDEEEEDDDDDDDEEEEDEQQQPKPSETPAAAPAAAVAATQPEPEPADEPLPLPEPVVPVVKSASRIAVTSVRVPPLVLASPRPGQVVAVPTAVSSPRPAQVIAVPAAASSTRPEPAAVARPALTSRLQSIAKAGEAKKLAVKEGHEAGGDGDIDFNGHDADEDEASGGDASGRSDNEDDAADDDDDDDDDNDERTSGERSLAPKRNALGRKSFRRDPTARGRPRTLSSGEAPHPPKHMTMASYIYVQSGEAMKSTLERKRLRDEGGSAEGDARKAAAGPGRPSAPAPEMPSEAANVSYAPQVRIVDGKLVLDEQSLVVPAGNSEPVVYDSTLTLDTGTRVTSASYTHRPPSERWTPEETNRFFEALQFWGTDFTLIATMFPGRDRRQIKYKYKREERANPTRLNLALRCRKPVDAATLALVSGRISADKSKVAAGKASG